MEVKNAVIESVTLEKVDRGFLQCWLHLSYGGSGQGFGGYVLYLPKSYSHHELKSIAGHFIFRCMEIAGVERWEHLPGRTIRVRSDLEKVHSIGHIVTDDWFDPTEDFSAKAEADEESEALRDMLGSARSDLEVMRNALGVPVEPRQSLTERMVEAAQAKRGAVPEGWRLVPIEFVRGFNALAHNCSLRAEPPDYYRGLAGDAFSAAYKRCGADLAHLRAMLPAVPAACRTCNGHGVIGGLLPNGGGYQSDPCPECSDSAPAPADDASLSTCQARLFDVLVGDDGQAWAEAERYLETARPDLYAALRREVKPAKCDGNHGGPRCADPECWNDGPIALILDELRRAVTKFPTWPTDPLHALAVLGEEFGELTKATLQTTYEPHKSSHEDVRTEAIQTAAMALRFVISLERYEYTQGIQHQQEGQPA